MLNAHIINCKETDYETFVKGGYLGVGIVTSGTKPAQLSLACKTSYSMYADMKTVRRGDVIFVHAGQKIYGAFRAASEFMEDGKAPSLYLSKNIHYQPDPNIMGSGWKNVKHLPDAGYYRKVAIGPFTDAKGNSLCFSDGFDSNEVFELKSQNRIFSVPERWKYTDAARTVRPLLMFEATELLHLLQRANADMSKRLNPQPAVLKGYLPIEPTLNPALAEDEKIVEAHVLGEIGRGGQLDVLLGPIESFGNNMPSGYLKFIDILGYVEFSPSWRKFRVTEIKKGHLAFPEDIHQLIGYLDWVTKTIGNGDHRNVEGIVIAHCFPTVAKDFVANYNRVNTGRKIKLIRFDYDPPNYKRLNFLPA